MTELSRDAADTGTQSMRPPSAAGPVTGGLVSGRYRLDGKLGRGSSADVYRASDEVLGRAVAVKVFRFDTAMGDDRRRVDAEMRMLASLQHPGLVAVFDAGTIADDETVTGETHGTPYLVMELVNGPSLSRRLDDGPLTSRDAAVLGAEVATALAYIHARNIVHRDVKPANILLGAEVDSGDTRTAKLADFGIARAVDGTRFTSDGLTIGTPNYLSPEQAMGHEVGPAADVYALGLVLIQCLTGEPAFPGSGLETALVRLHRQPVIPTDLGTGWVRLLTAMTARAADQRPNAADAARSLHGLARDEPATVTGPRPPLHGADADGGTGETRPLPARGRGRRGLVVAVGIGVLVLVVLVTLGIRLVDSTRGGGPGTPAAPAPYPSVSGQLGSDLQQLQRIVQ